MIRELTPEEKEQRRKLNERLKDRKPLDEDWRLYIGIPKLDER
jgi:hypothetical protein